MPRSRAWGAWNLPKIAKADNNHILRPQRGGIGEYQFFVVAPRSVNLGFTESNLAPVFAQETELRDSHRSHVCRHCSGKVPEVFELTRVTVQLLNGRRHGFTNWPAQTYQTCRREARRFGVCQQPKTVADSQNGNDEYNAENCVPLHGHGHELPVTNWAVPSLSSPCILRPSCRSNYRLPKRNRGNRSRTR